MSAPGLPCRRPDGSIGVELDYGDHDPPSMADAVRAYCALGWHCFLLAPNSKKPPMGTRGFLDATNNADELLAGLAREPRSNLGIATDPSGLAVVDVDPRNGGDVTLAEGVRDFGPIGRTPSVCTWSAGGHLYYGTDRTITSGAHKLGRGLDVKSARGYVVAPPSTIDGEPYRWREDGATLRPLSGWLLARLTREAEPAKPAAKWSARPTYDQRRHDVRKRAERAVRWVERCDPAISGQGGHAQTWDVVLAVVRGFDLPIEIASEIVRWYGARCEPPWSARELEHKIADAQRANLPRGFKLEGGRV